MQPKYARIINFLYGPYLRIIAFFYRIYSTNRARLARFKSNQGVARVLRALSVLVVVAWILIWFFASDADRTRLSDEVRQSIGGLNSTSNPATESQPAAD